MNEEPARTDRESIGTDCLLLASLLQNLLHLRLLLRLVQPLPRSPADILKELRIYALCHFLLSHVLKVPPLHVLHPQLNALVHLGFKFVDSTVSIKLMQ